MVERWRWRSVEESALGGEIDQGMKDDEKEKIADRCWRGGENGQ